MKRSFALPLLLFIVPAVAIAAPASEAEFFRLRKDSSGRLQALETSVVHFTSVDTKQSIVVDLISAVHIGEKSYYKELSERFKKYDALLFELIAPEEKVKALKERDKESTVSAIQQTMKDMLQLEFQLDEIDYTSKNMVHADLTPEKFSAALAARGDSIWSLIAKVVLRSLADPELQANEGDDLRLMLTLLANSPEERPYTLRRYLAENFTKVEGLAAKIEGPKGSTIIADRNEQALTVLAREMKAGKRRLGIFYGAAHMPGIAEQLEKRFKLKKSGTEWLVAWRLSRK